MFAKGISFMFFPTRPLKAALLAGVGVLALASSTQAVVNYTTSFESPTFTSGTSVAGIDGWVAGSGSGGSQTATNTRANTGTQSLLFDNTGSSVSFYSVYHPLGTFAGTILTLSVNLYVPSTNGVDRNAEVEFSTGTLGGVLGISIDSGATFVTARVGAPCTAPRPSERLPRRALTLNGS